MGAQVKVPLIYQASEYDCAPATLLNAISYLFERRDIPPVIVRNIVTTQVKILEKIISYCYEMISWTNDVIGSLTTIRFGSRCIDFLL